MSPALSSRRGADNFHFIQNHSSKPSNKQPAQSGKKFHGQRPDITLKCRTSMGPNEVDVKDLASLPNASEKDAAAPAIQKYAEPPKPQVSIASSHTCRALRQTVMLSVIKSD